MEGLTLIASPCILPVLSMLISTSADGDRKRSYGIIAGFVLAFSLFAFLFCTDISGFLIIVSFAIGAGSPMLIIALTGRKIMSGFSFLKKRAEGLRKLIGMVIIASVCYIVFDSYLETLLLEPTSQKASAEQTLQLENGLKKPYSAPEFSGLQGWINSQPLAMSELKGKVVLIDFWTYSCINCIRTLPHLTSWHKEYRDQGLVIIGIHSPEFAFEKDSDKVKKAVKQHGIEYPVALDNNFDTWQKYKNRYWPAYYLINRNGQVVYTHFGEGSYDVTENNIRYLLGFDKKDA